ncbi:hypothetical protein J2X68_005721 [Streptomyces sp. 3330]|nr:hypothetical protein [Streptomyces sp. 3330]
MVRRGRDLGDAAVGGAEQTEDLRRRQGAHVRPAVVGGDGDGEQPGGRQRVQPGPGQAPFAVAGPGSGAELLGERGRHGECLGVVGDHMG